MQKFVQQHLSTQSRVSLFVVALLAFGLWATLLASQQTQETRTQATAGNWYNANWKYRKAITINASKVVESQTNFPVLVSLTSDSDLSGKARSDGYDVVFTASDGVTKLSMERESYSNGTLVAWVNVPTLSSSTNTTLYLYYGNSSSCDQTAASCDASKNAKTAWNSNYKGVWHLKDSLGLFSTQVADSTGNGNIGTTHGWMAAGSQVPGKIDGSFYFNGSEQHVSLPASTSLNSLSSQMTVSAWAKGSSFDSEYRRIISRDTYPNQRWFIENDGAFPGHLLYDSGNGGSSSQTLNPNSWYYVTMTVTSSKISLYVNGFPSSSVLGVSSIATTGNIGIGGDVAGYPYWIGGIDEVRLSNVAHSATWIATEYNNQNAPASFYTVSAEQAPSTPTVVPPTNTPTAVPTATKTPTPAPTNVPTSTPTAVPTATPTTPAATATPVPSATAIPSPTSTPSPNGTKFSLNLLLHGIGKGGDSSNAQSQGNMTPVHAQRKVKLDVYDTQNQLVTTKEGIVTFNPAAGNFIGTVDMGDTFESGIYTLRVKSDQYLRSLIPGIQTVTAGSTVTLPQATLITGDVNNDNLVNILDYNIMMGCYSDFLPPVSCTAANKLLADITDDGNVNQFDYNLFIRELNTRGGE